MAFIQRIFFSCVQFDSAKAKYSSLADHSKKHHKVKTIGCVRWFKLDSSKKYFVFVISNAISIMYVVYQFGLIEIVGHYIDEDILASSSSSINAETITSDSISSRNNNEKPSKPSKNLRSWKIHLRRYSWRSLFKMNQWSETLLTIITASAQL